MSKKTTDPGIQFLRGRAIDQVGILVEDLDAAVERHVTLWPDLGWKVWEYGSEYLRSIKFEGAEIEASWRAGLNSATPQIELIEPVSGPGAYGAWIDRHGYGMHHVGLVVESFDDAVEEMRSSGFEPVQEGIGFGLDGDGAFAFFDTSAELGFWVEIIVRPARRRDPVATFGPQD